MEAEILVADEFLTERRRNLRAAKIASSVFILLGLSWVAWEFLWAYNYVSEIETVKYLRNTAMPRFGSVFVHLGPVILWTACLLSAVSIVGVWISRRLSIVILTLTATMGFIALSGLIFRAAVDQLQFIILRGTTQSFTPDRQ
jgi:hypothetical protein